MEKRCKDCIYKGYEEQDKRRVWPFCTNQNEDLRKVANEWAIKIDSTKKRDKLPEEVKPSCQLVQAGYSELYNKVCPYYKGVENDN